MTYKNYRKEPEFLRGEVYMVDLHSYTSTRAIKGVRPCVIVQNNFSTTKSSTVVVLPLTTNTSRSRIPTTALVHTKIPTSRVVKESLVLADNPYVVDKDLLMSYVTTLSDFAMEKVNYAIGVSLGLIEHDPSKRPTCNHPEHSVEVKQPAISATN